MKYIIEKIRRCFHVIVCFVFVEGMGGSLIFASTCHNIFSTGRKGIDYSIYHPSVIRIEAEGQKKIPSEDIIRTLNYMLADDSLVDTVEPIIYQLRWVQKTKGTKYFEQLMNLFSMVSALYKTESKYVKDLIKYMYLSKTFEQNLIDILDIMNEYNQVNGWFLGDACSSVVVSHNVLLTAAHCIFNRVSIGARVDKDHFVDATAFFHELAVVGSSKKFLYDVGVLVFPEHTFDKFIPLRVRSPKDLDVDGIYGAIGIDIHGVKKWGDVIIEREEEGYLASQNSPFRSSHGESGGPLINSKGEIVGLISSVVQDESGRQYDMYVSILTESNYSFLQSLVRKGIKIEGIR